MPTVPRVTGPEVAPQGLPNAMLSTAGGDAAAFGGIQARQIGEAAAVAQRAVANQQHEDRLREAEEKRLAEEQRRAADHAQLIVATNAAKERLTEAQEQFGNGVLDGTIPKEHADADFRKATAKVLEEAGKALPHSRRAEALSHLQVDAANSARTVRRAVTLRDRQDVTAGITQTLEYLQRQYQKEPAKATAQAMETLDQLGPFSNFTPDQVAKLRQGWKEQTQEVAAFSLVQGAKNNPKALDGAEAMLKSPDALPDLDPQKRAAFLDHVDNYRERLQRLADAARERALREQERHERRAATMTEEAGKLALSGTLSPEYMTALITATRGTASQAAIEQLQSRQRETGPLAAQPLAVQQATLDAVNADIVKNGISPARSERRAQIEAVVNATRADVKTDDARAYLARAGQGRQVAPLNLAGGITAAAPQIAARRQFAEEVEQFTGKPSSGLFGEEELQLRQAIDKLAPADQAGAIATITQALGTRSALALADRIGKDDQVLRLQIQSGADMTASGRLTSEWIGRGRQAVKENSQKAKDAQTLNVRASIADEIGDAISGPARADIIEAAYMAYIGEAASGMSPSPKGVVELVLRGPIVEHNGKRIPVPVGGLDKFRDRLRAMPADAIKAQAPDGMVYGRSGPKTVAQFLAELPNAQLEPAGQGRYVVPSGTGVVANAKGAPIFILAN